MKTVTASKHPDVTTPAETGTGDLNPTLGEMLDHAIEEIT